MGLVNVVRAARAARCRGRSVVRRDLRAQPHRASRSPSASSTPIPHTIRGIAGMGMYALKLYYETEESNEGVNAPERKAQAATSASTPSRANGLRLHRTSQARSSATAQRFADEQLAPPIQARDRDGRSRADARDGRARADRRRSAGGVRRPGSERHRRADHRGDRLGDLNVGYMQLLASLIGRSCRATAAPELARTWLPRHRARRGAVALGLTEPRGGSDAGQPALRRERDGDGYVLNGEKTSISRPTRPTRPSCSRAPARSRRRARRHRPPRADGPAGHHPHRFDDHRHQARSAAARCSSTTCTCRPNTCSADESKGFAQVMQGFDFSRALIGLQCAGAGAGVARGDLGVRRRAQGLRQADRAFQGVTYPLAEAETQSRRAAAVLPHAVAARSGRAAHRRRRRCANGGRPRSRSTSSISAC